MFADRIMKSIADICIRFHRGDLSETEALQRLESPCRVFSEESLGELRLFLTEAQTHSLMLAHESERLLAKAFDAADRTLPAAVASFSLANLCEDIEEHAEALGLYRNVIEELGALEEPGDNVVELIQKSLLGNAKCLMALGAPEGGMQKNPQK